MLRELGISDFLTARSERTVIDVRAPKEFASGHIPGAVNIPLFTDEERAVVGTTYKRVGREAAIRKGLQITGPKLEQFLNAAQQAAPNRKLAMHCWRGGMRSKSMATLFDFAGFDVAILKGGYKAYRRQARAFFEQPLPLIILGGKTGSGKTEMLKALSLAGEQIIDLEQLAHHKGSAFGDLGELPQPGTEMFENALFEQCHQLDVTKRIWVEDESHMIGTVFIPEPFWTSMRSAPVVYCDVPVEERIRFLVDTYGHYDAAGLVQAVHKITKRLGGQHAKAALTHFDNGQLDEATRIVLVYYDKTYAYGLSQRNPELLYTLAIPKIQPSENAQALIAFANTLQVHHEQIK